MERPSTVIARCGMMAALGVVIMLIGHVLGLGLYAAPMFVGLSLVPMGNRFGRKYHVLLWLVIAFLSAIVGVSAEQTLFFAVLFGPYPILRPVLTKLPKLWCILAKLAYFNAVSIGVEVLVLYLFAPEAFDALLWVLLALGNVLFFCFDFVIPHTELLFRRLRQRLGRK
ncbi:MAG: hypothetical protein IKU55_02280 [Clostridia bacterium]|nr:hypothetical protein [Clostridia bacterium]